MANDPKAMNWQVILFAGMADFAAGVGLIVAGLTGFLGEDGWTFALVGVVIVVAGAGIILFARNKMSQGSDPGGRLD